jgi:hypothetical protein
VLEYWERVGSYGDRACLGDFDEMKAKCWVGGRERMSLESPLSSLVGKETDD